MENSFSRSFFFSSLSYGICLNGVMSPFPLPHPNPPSGHHRQGKLEGNFHIKEEGLAGFKLSQVMQRKTGSCSRSDKFIFNYRKKKKKHPGSRFIFRPDAVINFSSTRRNGSLTTKPASLVDRIKVTLHGDVGLKNRPEGSSPSWPWNHPLFLVWFNWMWVEMCMQGVCACVCTDADVSWH